MGNDDELQFKIFPLNPDKMSISVTRLETLNQHRNADDVL